ncbi:MAG: twin-arginine translocase TatA/TatE family subunit [Nitrospirae bacterium]|nr:twin-arginine translocase TatA/TatE family subunit [Nitrospirota bacterium]
MFGGIGTTELIIILIIVLLLFGASRLPEIGKGIGQAIRSFKKGMSEPEEIDVTPKKPVEKKEEKEKEKEKEEEKQEKQKGE